MGAVASTWDLAAAEIMAANVPGYRISLVEAAPALVFSAVGNFTAVDLSGAPLWGLLPDPVHGEFSSRPAAARGGAHASAGGNYQQGAGSSAIDAATGAVAWALPSTGAISTTGVPTTAGPSGR